MIVFLTVVATVGLLGLCAAWGVVLYRMVRLAVRLLHAIRSGALRAPNRQISYSAEYVAARFVGDSLDPL